MTRLDRFAFACALAMSIVACGNNGGGGGGDDEPATDGPEAEPLVNGEPASQYYNRFAHATTRTGVNGAAAFPTTADGRNVFLVHFFLMPDNELHLFYEEGSGEVTSTGFSINTIAGTQKRRTGAWQVDGAQLVLDSFMRCDGFLFNDSPALRCTLTSPILTSDAQGRSGTFRKLSSEASPDDSDFADYVQ